MSRNGSGTYTLPSGNPVVSGTLIEASWANTTLSDIATALTGSLSRSAEGGMLAALRLFDGTSSVPGLAWGSETTTGFYRAGAGDTRLVVTGSEVQKWLSTGVAITGTLSASGNFAINTDKFTVAASSGNTAVAGTLAVTGTSTFTGAITANGGVVGAVTGNASTATALQNSRTIWGQSFNGTANVTGALTGVTDITASGNGSFGGTLGVTGAATLSSTLAVTGATTFSGQTNTFSNATAYYPQIINRNTTSDANASYFVLDKIRGSSVVQNGDVLGNLVFRGYDGTQYLQGAYINAIISATPGTNDMPTDLVFGTTPDAGAGPSERMRLDKAGNLGLGVTPSAWSTSQKALQVGNTAAFYNASNGAFIGNNVYNNNTPSSIYLTSSYATAYGQTSNGQHQWFTAPSGTAGNAISFTQAMTLDASGNLGIGTTTADGRLTVVAPASTKYGAFDCPTNGWGYFAYKYNGTGYGYIGQGSAVVNAGSSTDFAFQAVNNLVFATNGANERARIDSSGNLLVGTTSQVGSGRVGVSYSGASFWGLALNDTNGASGNRFVDFGRIGTSVGSISLNGTTAVAYNTSSDYRLKEDIQPMTGALAKVAALKPCTYKWKVDGSDGEGFIAHELAEVAPQCVTGEKDAVDADGNPVYQGIDTSFLVATLTAAIQEQQAIINAQQASLQTITARIEALEAK